ncbi:hypothetical protein JOE38_000227 [Clavibacter michiganensis]|uniref:hypothetical protein n=1 Tax=Clavibacter michiganensis TaxID=28447 RepID=UPI00195D9485|nr:hypothetical protein [Clavibacter michiganensis]MBM7410404.1 hypothetical protein [Clavibacter michiganensis]
MSLIDRPLAHPVHRRASAAWRIVAAALLATSAALQLHASAARWITAAASWDDPEAGVQDGRYDHSFPSRDWVPLGDAAETHGIGMLLLALAVLAVARAVRITGATGVLGVALVAGCFAAIGTNALVAGLTGTATPLGDAYLRVHLLGLAGAVVVAVAMRRGRAPGATAWEALGAVLILGNGLVGQLLALFVIAPAIWGGSYSDTPIHTESVVATSTACAAVAMLVAAVLARHRARVLARDLVSAA